MSKSRQAQRKLPPHEAALRTLEAHYLLGPVARHIQFYARSRYARFEQSMSPTAYCEISGLSTVVYNDALKLSESSWLGILSLATLVLAVGAPKRLTVPSPLSDLTAQLAALHWWRTVMKTGELPEHFELPPEVMQWGRLPLEELIARLKNAPMSGLHNGAWTITRSSAIPLMQPDPNPAWTAVHGTHRTTDHEEIFAQAMVDNAKRALQVQHEANHPCVPGSNPNSHAAQAKRWLIAHYPLLGSLLTQFDIVEDTEVCRRLDIQVAAIHVGAGEIYINPARHLGLEAAKFVVAHEVLHAGLCHSSRRQGRDPYLWNVACDFVINDWLVAMGLGTPPDFGMLFDEELRGWSAEDIYVRLALDLRIKRRLNTFRGGDCDLLDGTLGNRAYTDREEFCRRALLQGLDYHQAAGRGTLPIGLVETIRTLNQAPIPWQAKLAEWIRERFALPLRQRTYARPSRRQSVTPDIPRPRFIQPEDMRASRTFAVIIDTSGSMERDDLGKALGAVVSYAQAQEVQQVRLIYCDATPYDEGFVAIESLATRVAVRGRGGTVLQPAIDFLQTRQDFPKDGPVLIVTDGFCEDDLSVKRDHAYLLTPGRRLPFRTHAPVFTMR